MVGGLTMVVLAREGEGDAVDLRRAGAMYRGGGTVQRKREAAKDGVVRLCLERVDTAAAAAAASSRSSKVSPSHHANSTTSSQTTRSARAQPMRGTANAAFAQRPLLAFSTRRLPASALASDRPRVLIITPIEGPPARAPRVLLLVLLSPVRQPPFHPPSCLLLHPLISLNPRGTQVRHTTHCYLRFPKNAR